MTASGRALQVLQYQTYQNEGVCLHGLADFPPSHLSPIRAVVGQFRKLFRCHRRGHRRPPARRRHVVGALVVQTHGRAGLARGDGGDDGGMDGAARELAAVRAAHVSHAALDAVGGEAEGVGDLRDERRRAQVPIGFNGSEWKPLFQVAHYAMGARNSG